MKQITSFMSEISDEFKTIVVQAIQSVCIKFPRKHHILMTFLSSMLREEGGADYKKAIVNTIITIIEENQDAKEAGGWSHTDCAALLCYSSTHSLLLMLSSSSHLLWVGWVQKDLCITHHFFSCSECPLQSAIK